MYFHFNWRGALTTTAVYAHTHAHIHTPKHTHLHTEVLTDWPACTLTQTNTNLQGVAAFDSLIYTPTHTRTHTPMLLIASLSLCQKQTY